MAGGGGAGTIEEEDASSRGMMLPTTTPGTSSRRVRVPGAARDASVSAPLAFNLRNAALVYSGVDIMAAAGETRVTLDAFPNGRAVVHLEIPRPVHVRMQRAGIAPLDVFDAMVHVAPKIGVVAVDLPSMADYFDGAGSLLADRGPSLAAALGVGSGASADPADWLDAGLGQRGLVLARVDRHRARFHLAEPTDVPLTGDPNLPLGFVPCSASHSRSSLRADATPDDADRDACPLVRTENAVVHEAVTPRGCADGDGPAMVAAGLAVVEARVVDVIGRAAPVRAPAPSKTRVAREADGLGLLPGEDRLDASGHPDGDEAASQAAARLDGTVIYGAELALTGRASNAGEAARVAAAVTVRAFMADLRDFGVLTSAEEAAAFRAYVVEAQEAPEDIRVARGSAAEAAAAVEALRDLVDVAKEAAAFQASGPGNAVGKKGEESVHARRLYSATASSAAADDAAFDAVEAARHAERRVRALVEACAAVEPAGRLERCYPAFVERCTALVAEHRRLTAEAAAALHRRRKRAERQHEKARVAAVVASRDVEADERRAANRDAARRRLEKRAEDKAREEARAALALLRGSAGRLLVRLTRVARRLPSSALPRDAEPALVRLEAATHPDNADVAAAEAVASEALLELSDVVERTSDSWTCAEVMLCLGALAAATPSRAARDWTSATLALARDLTKRLHADAADVASTLEALSATSAKAAAALAALAATGCAPMTGEQIEALPEGKAQTRWSWSDAWTGRPETLDAEAVERVASWEANDARFNPFGDASSLLAALRHAARPEAAMTWATPRSVPRVQTTMERLVETARGIPREVAALAEAVIPATEAAEELCGVLDGVSDISEDDRVGTDGVMAIAAAASDLADRAASAAARAALSIQDGCGWDGEPTRRFGSLQVGRMAAWASPSGDGDAGPPAAALAVAEALAEATQPARAVEWASSAAVEAAVGLGEALAGCLARHAETAVDASAAVSDDALRRYLDATGGRRVGVSAFAFGGGGADVDGIDATPPRLATLLGGVVCGRDHLSLPPRLALEAADAALDAADSADALTFDEAAEAADWFRRALAVPRALAASERRATAVAAGMARRLACRVGDEQAAAAARLENVLAAMDEAALELCSALHLAPETFPGRAGVVDAWAPDGMGPQNWGEAFTVESLEALTATLRPSGQSGGQSPGSGPASAPGETVAWDVLLNLMFWLGGEARWWRRDARNTRDGNTPRWHTRRGVSLAVDAAKLLTLAAAAAAKAARAILAALPPAVDAMRDVPWAEETAAALRSAVEDAVSRGRELAGGQGGQSPRGRSAAEVGVARNAAFGAAMYVDEAAQSSPSSSAGDLDGERWYAVEWLVAACANVGGVAWDTSAALVAAEQLRGVPTAASRERRTRLAVRAGLAGETARMVVALTSTPGVVTEVRDAWLAAVEAERGAVSEPRLLPPDFDAVREAAGRVQAGELRRALTWATERRKEAAFRRRGGRFIGGRGAEEVPDEDDEEAAAVAAAEDAAENLGVVNRVRCSAEYCGVCGAPWLEDEVIDPRAEGACQVDASKTVRGAAEGMCCGGDEPHWLSWSTVQALSERCDAANGERAMDYATRYDLSAVLRKFARP